MTAPNPTSAVSATVLHALLPILLVAASLAPSLVSAERSADAARENSVVARSLAEFLACLPRSNLHVQLAPGTYPLTRPLAFSGSDSTYDLIGVRFEYRIAEVGAINVNVVDVTGDRVTIKGLHLEATGEQQCPKGHARAILISGHHNTLEGVTVTTRGSFPYGYGNLFGRGGGEIFTIRKFNGIVVHGNESRLLNCTVMSHTFGHGIALHETPQNTLIRGCTVTGSLRHTDDILRETSGPAFQRNFKMYTDAPIPPHKVISASEDGIRVYGPKTRGVTIENTTIKHMRGGLGLEAALPPVRVTGCRIIECEYACYIGTDAVVENTAADARHGPALVTFAAKPGSDHPYPADHRNSRVELRILDSTNPSGPHPIARLGGREHHITFSSAPGAVTASAVIEITGGATYTSEITGSFPRGGDKRPTRIELTNRTAATVLLHEDASECQIASAGPVDDKGKANRITQLRP